jgi:sulfur relay (sulfurtransferase) complex TusBCD TusD component (DsrE family)
MKTRSHLRAAVIVLVVLSGWMGSACAEEALLINLTSHETSRAAMAVFFAHSMMTEKGICAVLFLNVDGVRLANQKLPGNKYVDGETVQQKLAAFMKAGGRVYACPMCMKNVGGMEPADLLPGVEVATVENIHRELYEFDTRVLSY